MKKWKFVEMDCPVCGKTHFYLSSPNPKMRKAEEKEYENGEEMCSYCGWIYDLNQAEKPDSLEGFNSKSLNDYRKWYQNKIVENPDFDYANELYKKSGTHLCPVCRKYRFPSEGSFDICPFCGWEDDGSEEWDSDTCGPNPVPFKEYKRRYLEEIKKNPSYKWEIEVRKR